MLSDGQAIHAQMYGTSFDNIDDMHTTVAFFIRAVIVEMETNTLGRQMVSYPQAFDLVIR